MDFLKKSWQDITCVLVFLLISFFYFMTPVTDGLVLHGDDNTGGLGMGHELKEYYEATGEHTRWTNSTFSGMPTYQIAPSYDSANLLMQIQHIYQLGTSGVLCYLFLYLLGFYIMLRAFNIKPALAALGSIAWAFSSYFLIIIAAGHIWKVMTLCFIPPTIGGLVLCYRGKYLWGGAVTALFTAFQILSNHVQMSYYFFFLMLCIVLAYLVQALIKTKKAAKEPDVLGIQMTFSRWWRATCVVIVAGIVGVATNVPNLYHTYQYTQQSMRGASDLTQKHNEDNKATDGLERNYITAWSYGIGESMTFLIPDVKGGGTGSILSVEDLATRAEMYQYTQQAQAAQGMLQEKIQNKQLPDNSPLPGLNQYWGDQPFTVGPVYVGAIICMLFVMGLFYVRGPIKWALLAATVISFLFAWGRHIMPFTDILIDYLPLYSKFRTVSSALVVAEFTFPLMAVLCLASLIRKPEQLREKPLGFYIGFGLTAGTCLLFWLVPTIGGDLLSADEANVTAALGQPALTDSINRLRGIIVSESALRSLIFILIGGGLTFFILRSKNKTAQPLLCIGLAVLCLADLWSYDRKYLNDSNFTLPSKIGEMLEVKTPADEVILKDTSVFRVVDLSKNIFNDNSTGYWHKSIGGYHAAKLHRYNDLINYRLTPELQKSIDLINLTQGNLTEAQADSLLPTLNMLNLKYYIVGGGQNAQPIVNPGANGNAWMVQNLTFVENADEEINALATLDTKHAAVAEKLFKNQLDGTPLDSGSVSMTSYAPNELHYNVETGKGGVVVFSEIYYPGWSAYIDGQEAELGRVNYVLRALKVPAGKHEVKLEFRPASVSLTESVSYAAIALVLLVFCLALWFENKDKLVKKQGKKQTGKE